MEDGRGKHGNQGRKKKDTKQHSIWCRPEHIKKLRELAIKWYNDEK